MNGASNKKSRLEYLSIPLNCSSKLPLPYVIYSNDQYEVVLKKFNEDDLERAFRLKVEPGDQPNTYRMVYKEELDQFNDSNMAFALHDMQHQLCVTPKNGTIGEKNREYLSIAIECALGQLDEYASWVYNNFSTIATRGVYRSYQTMREASAIGEREANTMKNILGYEETEHLPQHKFDTLKAILRAARHQAGASDVACVLYFSVLEAIFVDDNKELSYKLSMRLASYMRKDYNYAKKIAKLYSKRSKVIHGSNKGNVFSREECQIVETLAIEAFEAIVVNSTRFTERALDSQLLVNK